MGFSTNSPDMLPVIRQKTYQITQKQSNKVSAHTGHHIPIWAELLMFLGFALLSEFGGHLIASMMLARLFMESTAVITAGAFQTAIEVGGALTIDIMTHRTSAQAILLDLTPRTRCVWYFQNICGNEIIKKRENII